MHFHQATVLLGRAMWNVLEEGDSDNIPTWFVKGRTVLIPKVRCEGRPEQHRHIACLTTVHKLLTAMQTEVSYNYAMAHAYLPPEQRAIQRGHRGCLDAMIIDSMVTQATTAYGCTRGDGTQSQLVCSLDRLSEDIQHSTPCVVERGVIRKESTSVCLAYAGMPAAEVELSVLCGDWGEH